MRGLLGIEPYEICRVMAETSGMAVVVLDKDGHRLYVNEAAVKMLGRSKEELIDGAFSDVLSPEERERAWEGFHKCIQSAQPVHEFISRPLVGGGAGLTSANWGPLKDQAGNVVGVLIMFRDVTEVEAREERLRQARELYHTLVEAVGGAALRVNREGKRTFASDYAAQFTGRSKEDILAGSFGDTMVPEDRERAWAALQQTFETGEPVYGFVSRQILRGEERHIQANWVPIRDRGGKIVEVQTTSFDITEQVRLREQMELYSARIRRAHEDERLAVSRFLHDDTIQALLVVADTVREMTDGSSVSGQTKEK